MTGEEVLLQQIQDLQKTISSLEKQNKDYKKIIDARNLKDANQDYKDRLFKFIFGNPENKQWTLSLYNAVNGTNYTNPDEIQINTLADIVYMKMKNDVSFLIHFEMSLWEHQSTYNPNMPMRFFLYAGSLYHGYVASSDYYEYSSTLQPVPLPKCVCFYNGTKEQPRKQTLKLSDAYNGKGDIEVKVTMLNINYGKNQKLMDACHPLKEYAWLVDTVRKHQKEKMDLDAAVDAALDEMPDDYEIKLFLVKNRAEVKSMFLTEYNEEKVLAKERNEGDRLAREGIATDMLKEGGQSISYISRMTKLSEKSVQDLAKTLGIVV